MGLTRFRHDKFSYGLGALGKDFACSSFISFSCTTTPMWPACRRHLWELFLVVRMIDAVSDPVMGRSSTIPQSVWKVWALDRPRNSDQLMVVALFSAHLFQAHSSFYLSP